VKSQTISSPARAAQPGRLYVVATPIGNLADITLRALNVLKDVDLIAAEDTRRTRQLLQHYQISKPLLSYHSHNETARAPALLSQLQAGKSVALVSDAGTPGFSDPGTALVARAWETGIPVTAIPGPAAGLAALSMSGFDGDVTFIGFLPRQAGKRLAFFGQLAREARIFIIYESPRRLPRTLQELSQTMGDRRILVVRELTKLFEECWRGPLASVAAQLVDKEIKGECTLVLSRPQAPELPVVDVKAYLLEAASSSHKTGRALALEASEVLGISRREAYQAYLSLKAAKQVPEK
jgi:16S rRNA (cytidine1402-2'-O)-methyltransferase